MRRRNSNVTASYQVRLLLSIRNAPPRLPGLTTQKLAGRPAAILLAANKLSFAVPARMPANPPNVPPPPGVGLSGFMLPSSVVFAKSAFEYSAAQEPVPVPGLQLPALAIGTPLMWANRIGNGDVPVPAPK